VLQFEDGDISMSYYYLIHMANEVLFEMGWASVNKGGAYKESISKNGPHL
jgi:hypothetical protein